LRGAEEQSLIAMSRLHLCEAAIHKQSVPVMELLSWDAKNTTALPISSGLPNLPRETLLEIIFQRSWPLSVEASSARSPGVHLA
jgi:hypothetical protein